MVCNVSLRTEQRYTPNKGAPAVRSKADHTHEDVTPGYMIGPP